MKSKQDIAAIQQFGQKLKEARSLCKFTIQKSAANLNVNASELSRLESGVIDGGTNISPKFIGDAAKLYDVTSDFLLGLAGDEWERDPVVCFQRSIGAGMQRATNKRLAEIAAQLERQDRQIAAINGTTTNMVKIVSDLVEAAEKFRKLNPGFENLPGSANLLNRAKIAAKATNEARQQLIRCKILPLWSANEPDTKAQRSASGLAHHNRQKNESRT